MPLPVTHRERIALAAIALLITLGLLVLALA